MPKEGELWPPKRWSHAMEYCPQRKKIYIFGGVSVSLSMLNDLWCFDIGIYLFIFFLFLNFFLIQSNKLLKNGQKLYHNQKLFQDQDMYIVYAFMQIIYIYTVDLVVE